METTIYIDVFKCVDHYALVHIHTSNHISNY